MNATTWPSVEIDGRKQSPFACLLDESTLTRSVIPVVRSWTKMSTDLFESPVTSLDDSLWNATSRPSGEMAGQVLLPFTWLPEESTLTRSVIPVERSCTKTSPQPFVSPETRFELPLSKATNRPSAEIELKKLGRSP